MSSKFQNLHPYVCQRINSLFNLLSKKRTKLIGLLNSEFNSKNDNEGDKSAENSEASLQHTEVDIVIKFLISCFLIFEMNRQERKYLTLYHFTFLMGVTKFF